MLCARQIDSSATGKERKVRGLPARCQEGVCLAASLLKTALGKLGRKALASSSKKARC